MKISKITQVEELLAVINDCEGEVWLTSIYGDKFNMKSTLTQYVAIGALLGEHGDELELFASKREDEAKLLNFLNSHPEI